MKAIYKFEEELLKEFEIENPNHESSIDKLNKKDRHEVAGMLWILYNTINSWHNQIDSELEEAGKLGEILAELQNKSYERLVSELINNVNNFAENSIELDECIVREKEILKRDGKQYEVVIADDNIFVICEMSFNEEEGCFTTSYERPEIYANQESINTLEELKFERMI